MVADGPDGDGLGDGDGGGEEGGEPVERRDVTGASVACGREAKDAFVPRCRIDSVTRK